MRLLLMQGKHEEAEAVHREVVDARREVLGVQHPETLTTLAWLRKALREQGKSVEGLERV